MKKMIVAVMVLVLSLSFMNLTAMADININWEQETDKPTAAQGSAVGVVGSKVYVIGGGDVKGAVTKFINNVEIYDTVTKTWSIGAPMPTARSGAAYATIDGKIYVIGGISEGGILDTVEIYDVAKNSWSTGANKPTATYSSVSIVVNGKIYTLAGLNNLAAPFEIYDPATNSWTKEAPIPQAKRGIAQVINNGKIYLFGGRTDTNPAFNDVDIYDVATKKWSKGANMPYAVAFGSAHLIDGFVYFLGGSYGTESLISDSIAIYDINKNEWSVSSTTLPGGPRSSFRTATVNGRIYIIGGNIGTGTTDNSVYSFTINSNAYIMRAIIGINENLQLSVSKQLEENTELNWYSEDSAIASVDANGVVKGNAIGITKIWAETLDGTFKEFVNIEVVDEPDEYRLAVDIKVGEKRQLRFSRSKVPDEVWNSLDTSIVTVDSKGKITGISEGLAIVEAEYDGQVGQIYVRVRT